MSLVEIHARLADTSTLFVAILGLWALFLRLRSRPLDASWYGAAVVAELLLLVQTGLGALLYWQGLDVALQRPFMHILYGVVALITLPAAYAYFGNLEDERVKSLSMALVCFFLWGILLRATYVARFPPPAF